MMSIQLIMFDLGGVLVRRQPERLLAAVAKDTGLPAERLQRELAASTWIDQFERGRIEPRQLHEALTKSMGLTWTFEQFVSAWNGILAENTDTTWMLERLRSRYKLLALSNINVLHDEYIRATWPVFSQMHYWIASYQVGLRKPEPQIYQLALRQADVPPEAAVYVDDTAEFVAAARQLGVHAIHFHDGLELDAELRHAGVHV